MKYTWALFIAIGLAIGLAGCGGVGNSTNNNDNTNTTGISGTIVNGHWTTATYVSGDTTVTGSLIIDPGVTVTLASGYLYFHFSCYRVHRKRNRGTPHYLQECIVFCRVETDIYR